MAAVTTETTDLHISMLFPDSTSFPIFCTKVPQESCINGRSCSQKRTKTMIILLANVCPDLELCCALYIQQWCCKSGSEFNFVEPTVVPCGRNIGTLQNRNFSRRDTSALHTCFILNALKVGVMVLRMRFQSSSRACRRPELKGPMLLRRND